MQPLTKSDVEGYFTLNKRQFEMYEKIQLGKYKYIGLYGGGRSGKTMLILFMILFRAIRFPGSRHAIIRSTRLDVDTYIFKESFAKLLKFTNVAASAEFKTHGTDLTITLDNGSQIAMKGLDHERRKERILGGEYSTIYFNECSTLNYNLIPDVISRLAENICDINQVFYDFNPPSKAHWTYKYFVEHINPETKLPLPYKEKLFIGKLNPIDNPHKSSDYEELQSDQGEANYKRFIEGEFADIGGRCIHRDHFTFYSEEDVKGIEFSKIFMTTDFAKSKNITSDYNVLCVWGVTKGKYLYLLDTMRFKAISIDALPQLDLLYQYWRDGFKNGGQGLTQIYIEKPGNPDLVAILQRKHGNVISTDVMRNTNKYGRFSNVRGFIENQKIFLPHAEMFIRGIKVDTWLSEYLVELESFSENEKDYEHDDFADNVFDACYIATLIRRPAIFDATVHRF